MVSGSGAALLNKSTPPILKNAWLPCSSLIPSSYSCNAPLRFSMRLTHGQRWPRALSDQYCTVAPLPQKSGHIHSEPFSPGRLDRLCEKHETSLRRHERAVGGPEAERS